MKYKFKKQSCPGCPVGCSQIARSSSGDIVKIEWGALDALGPLLGVFSFQHLIELQWLVNQYGVDAKEIGSLNSNRSARINLAI